MQKTCISSYTLEQLAERLKAMGQPAFRGRQVFSWLHRGVTGFGEMSDLPLSLRQALGERFLITAPAGDRKQVSRLAGPVKYSGAWGTATAWSPC